jgi:hypothetical protein
VFQDFNLACGEKTIINFPTKKSWRKSSEYTFVEDGLDNLIEVISKNNIQSIAIPALGSGNGGLQWEKVKKLIEQKLSHLLIDVFVYEPTLHVTDYLKQERIKLTDARALLLFVLYDLVKNGEYVSEFSSEKICYFLQRFGAKKYFKLEFEPNFYGPYSGKVRYLLNTLNGSYIMGYSDMNKKPFEPLTLVGDGYQTVLNYINQKPELQQISQKTIEFLEGFYSDFALELFSSIDYLMVNNKTSDNEVICKLLEDWSDRKRSLFSDKRYLDISFKHLRKVTFVD